MVSSMAFDRASVDSRCPACVRLSWRCSCGCGPDREATFTASGAADPSAKAADADQGRPDGRQVVVGEMCPQGAGGRPAVAPLIMRGVGWTDARDRGRGDGRARERAAVLRARRRRQAGGRVRHARASSRSGSASRSRPARTSARRRARTVGATPATAHARSRRGSEVRPGDRRLRDRGRRDHAAATIRRDARRSRPAARACRQRARRSTSMATARIESFPIAGALDGIRAPAAEWTRVADRAPARACTPTFQLYDLKLAPEPRPGKPRREGARRASTCSASSTSTATAARSSCSRCGSRRCAASSSTPRPRARSASSSPARRRRSRDRAGHGHASDGMRSRQPIGRLLTSVGGTTREPCSAGPARPLAHRRRLPMTLALPSLVLRRAACSESGRTLDALGARRARRRVTVPRSCSRRPGRCRRSRTSACSRRQLATQTVPYYLQRTIAGGVRRNGRSRRWLRDPLEADAAM